MRVPAHHVFNHGPVFGALARTVLSGLRGSSGKVPEASELPTPAIYASVPPPPEGLVSDFVTHLGGDPRIYGHNLPPHLFPQWAFPLAARTLEGLPYPMLKVVNGGCRMEVRSPLPTGEVLTARACLQSIDDDGRRVVLSSRVVTGTVSEPDSLITDFYAIVPLPQPKGRLQAKAMPGAD